MDSEEDFVGMIKLWAFVVFNAEGTDSVCPPFDAVAVGVVGHDFAVVNALLFVDLPKDDGGAVVGAIDACVGVCGSNVVVGKYSLDAFVVEGQTLEPGAEGTCAPFGFLDHADVIESGLRFVVEGIVSVLAVVAVACRGLCVWFGVVTVVFAWWIVVSARGNVVALAAVVIDVFACIKVNVACEALFTSA